MSTIALAAATVIVIAFMPPAAVTANAEPDINCITGNATGLDTASPGFVRTYPTLCVNKFLATAHAENFSAPGGDTELVSLGKTACHTMDLDSGDPDHTAAKTVGAAEPQLTFTFTSASTFHEAPNELVRLAMNAMCP